MNKQILVVADSVANEKQVDKNVIFDAIAEALVFATKKFYGQELDIKVDLDRKTGDYQTFKLLTVVDDQAVEFPERQLGLTEAKKLKPAAVLGEVLEFPMESIQFGRIAAQTAKQVIVQKVREAERDKIADAYLSRLNEILMGVVKKVTRERVIVEVAPNVEARLERSDLLPRDMVRVGERIRGCLVAVEKGSKGPQLRLSRTAAVMLTELFKIEVPEIAEQLIEIMGVGRDPGSRAKLAVKTNDGRIDPVGACVGMRGSRVQAVSSELGGERVDIVLWDPDPVQYIINAMAPAEVVSVELDEDKHSMNIAVPEDQLAQAIGRNGQNVRLASELTGWDLKVFTESQAKEKAAAESDSLQKLFIQYLDIDEDFASVLINSGFTSLEELAQISSEYALQIEGLDEELINELRDRAKLALSKKAKAKAAKRIPQADLLALPGMDDVLAKKLAELKIITQEDLAEQSVDELVELTGLDRDFAAKLIMSAREPWFSNQEK